MSTLSLRKRLLIAATFTLIAFLGLAGIALDRAFQTSAKVTEKNLLKTQVNALLTALEIDDLGNLIIPDRLPEPRLAAANSGMYAAIVNGRGETVWRSKSSLGVNLDFITATAPGTETFYQLDDKLESPFYYSFGIGWELDQERVIEFSLVLVNESRNYIQVINSHRNELIFWLGMAGLLLLVMQGISLGWGLRPLRQVMTELDLIEHAKQKKITGIYPQEIAQLSRRINNFIENERKNLQRYRNTLGDLAHSLKTPLAVIKGIADKDQVLDKENINEHVERMNQIVEYQLKRAASSQFSVMHGAVDVQNILTKLDKSLHKVYADKNVRVNWHVESSAMFFGDQADLFELLGNTLDNAFKWSEGKLMYRVFTRSTNSQMRPQLTIEIHDDGPGIRKSERSAVLQRGARVDQQIPGQGIGLAVVREIVERYEGELDILTSDLGGALIKIVFPET